jgi:two-component system, LytTR family, response regulator
MSKVLIHTQSTIEVIDIHKIIRYEGCQNYVRVHKENGISMVSNEKLIHVATKMKALFLQSHKSHVVNLEKVVRYHKNGFLELSNGDKVPVARRRRTRIEEDLGKWLEARVEFMDRNLSKTTVDK